MKDRTDKELPDPVEGKPLATARRPENASTRHRGKHGVTQDDPWMDQVLESENLRQAWKRVKANKGAAGIDGMTTDDFPSFARTHWERICSDLKQGTYRPASVRRVFIPKPDGTERPLGIPTVLDRFIQQAISQVLTPLYDGEFSASSYGFRPGRNAHQAVRKVESAWRERRRYGVDCDLKAFFDTVNHDRLLERLRQKIGGGILLRLIGRYLRAGVTLPDGQREETPLGVPQGGPLSPLLANIALDPLDKELEHRGHTFARYADDFLVMVKSAKAAERVMASLTRFIEGTLKLVVNRTKSQTAPLHQCSFLGFHLSTRGKIKWTDKALDRFKYRVREITRRNRGQTVKDVLAELRHYVHGWINYFGISHTYREIMELDEWIRRRVRLYYWKQWKRPGTRRRHLIALGIHPDEVKMASRSRKGYWRMSANSIVQRGMTNQWLKEQGTPELRTTWIKLHYPDASRVV